VSPAVLITGANGFVGRHLQQTLADLGIAYRAAVRRQTSPVDPREFVVSDVGPGTDWNAALEGVNAVVHLAARAHIVKETARDPLVEFMRVNAEGTLRLAHAAVAAGVRRIIYLSSIGVLGNESGDSPFTNASPPNPHNAYAESKLAGEVAVRTVSSQIEVVVVRVPLVYGTGVRANFYRLLRSVDEGLPLPLGAIHNRRSLVSVWNLCDLLSTTLRHPAAPGRNWLVSDGEDLSTPELIRRLARHMQRKARLLPVPISVLNALGRLTGRQGQITQLCGSLALDITETQNELGWRPPVPVDEGLRRTVSWYYSSGSGQ